MRYYLTSVLLGCLFAFMILSCGKEDPIVIPPCENCLSIVILDSMEWDASVTSCGSMENWFTEELQFYFTITENQPLDVGLDDFTIRNVPAAPGHYAILKIDGFSFDPKASFVERKFERQARDIYHPADTLESFIDVEIFNLSTGEWKVSFQVALQLKAPEWVGPMNSLYPRSFEITGTAEGQIGN